MEYPRVIAGHVTDCPDCGERVRLHEPQAFRASLFERTAAIKKKINNLKIFLNELPYVRIGLSIVKTLFIYTIGLPYLCYRWKLKKIEAKKKSQRNLNERINESEQEDTGKRLEMPHEGKVEYNVPSIVILVLGFLSFFMGFFVLVSAPFELYTKNITTISFIVMFVLGLILIYLGYRMIKKSIIGLF